MAHIPYQPAQPQQTSGVLDETTVKQVFDEFKSNDEGKEYITFEDFERTIRKYNLQLMANLSPDDPDYSTVCLEMFTIISFNAQSSKAMLKQQSTNDLHENNTLRSKARANHAFKNNILKTSSSPRGSTPPKKIVQSQSNPLLRPKTSYSPTNQAQQKSSGAAPSFVVLGTKAQQHSRNAGATVHNNSRPISAKVGGGYALRHQKGKEVQSKLKKVNLLKEDKQKALQYKRQPIKQSNNLIMDVDKSQPAINLLNSEDILCLDFKTFLENYHRFVTLRKITNMIYDRLNKRLPRRPTSIKKVWNHNNDGQEVRMGSAKYKKNKNDPSFVIPDDTTNLKQDILQEEEGKRDEDSDDADMESRPDFTDSSCDDQFSRDSNYVLEEYHLYDDLATISEKNEEKREIMDLPSSEHGFDTYKLTNFKEIKHVSAQIDLNSSPQQEQEDSKHNEPTLQLDYKEEIKQQVQLVKNQRRQWNIGNTQQSQNKQNILKTVESARSSSEEAAEQDLIKVEQVVLSQHEQSPPSQKILSHDVSAQEIKLDFTAKQLDLNQQEAPSELRGSIVKENLDKKPQNKKNSNCASCCNVF